MTAPNSAQLATISDALNNVAAGIRERLRHEGANSAPHADLKTSIDLECARLRGEGQLDLANALAALRDA
jgi:hypothetical protein